MIRVFDLQQTGIDLNLFNSLNKKINKKLWTINLRLHIISFLLLCVNGRKCDGSNYFQYFWYYTGLVSRYQILSLVPSNTSHG